MFERSQVSVSELKSQMKRGEEPFFVNLRHSHDWDLAVMKARGALNLADDEVEQHMEEIPRNRPVIIYSRCPGDEPSIRAAEILRQHGWQDVHPLVGGFKAYLEAGLPVEEIGEGSKTRKIMLL